MNSIMRAGALLLWAYAFGSCAASGVTSDVDETPPVETETPEEPETSEPPALIDPTTDCTPYPSEQILREISIDYAAGTEPDPQEVEQIERILTLLPYSFSQGLNRIVIEQSPDCQIPDGRFARAATYSANGLIWLCRYQGPDGNDPNALGGVFEGFTKGDYTVLEFVMVHEIAHFVNYKSHRVADRYVDYILQQYPYFADVFIDDGDEMYANDVSRYFWYRNYLELQTPDDFSRRWTDGVSGSWLRDNLFCGIEYDVQTPYWQLNYALYFLQDCRDPDRALNEFSDFVGRFPDSVYYPQALYGEGRTFEECNHNTYMAVLIYRTALLEHPDTLSNVNERAMLNKIDNYYHGRAQTSEAISFYLEYLERYPTSSLLDRVLFLLGRCYFDTGDCVNATAILNRVVTEYPESQHAGSNETQTMLAECQE